jgi:hypothetical protein
MSLGDDPAFPPLGEKSHIIPKYCGSLLPQYRMMALR